MMESWRMSPWIILGSVLLLQVEQSYLQPISGPNVCGLPNNPHCCKGWMMHPVLQKCFVPTCKHDCGDGYCQRPNLCACRNGEHSTTGCGRDGDNSNTGGTDGYVCNPECVNEGVCGDGNTCVCPYGFMGQSCEIDYRTGPCFRDEDRGTCSDAVSGVRSTKILCCATVGQGWGDSCEPCSTVDLSCPSGYISDQRTGECIDVDECVVMPGVCDEGTCSNKVGGFTCEATGIPITSSPLGDAHDDRTGLCFANEDSGTCSDAVSELHSTKALCCATLGQGWGDPCESCYTLDLQCPRGFTIEQSTRRCVDVDECVVLAGICEGGRCENTEGGFACQGPPISLGSSGGAQGSATGPCFEREDAGTCSLPVEGLVTTKQLCCATVGRGWGESCESCKTFRSRCGHGYIQEDSIQQCFDVNECEVMPQVCRDGTCRNTAGSFVCEATGTPLSLDSSDGAQGIATGPCFTHEDAGTCSLPVEGLVTTKQLCCVTIGQGWGESCESCSTFRSRCVHGYYQIDNIQRCFDVNECEEMPEVCRGGTCRNTAGSFVCEATGTPLSVGQSADSGFCFTYENGGTCSLEVADFTASKELCCNTVGKGWGTSETCESCLKFESPCEKGFIQVTGTKDCVDVNECDMIPDLCQDGTCHNTEGAFVCEATGIPISSGNTSVNMTETGIPLSFNASQEEKGIPLSFNASLFEREVISLGQDGIRLMQVRGSDIQEFEVNLNLKFDLSRSEIYPRGDGDGMKEQVYAVAQENGIDSVEQFGVDICKRMHQERFGPVISCEVYIEQAPWRRVSQSRHAFIHSQEATRFAEVVHRRYESAKVWGGIKDMKILSTNPASNLGSDLVYEPNSGQYYVVPTPTPTTPPRARKGGKDTRPGSKKTERKGREKRATLINAVDCTVMWCKWLYSSPDDNNFDQTWESVQNQTLDLFADHDFLQAVSPLGFAYEAASRILLQLPQIDQMAVELSSYQYTDLPGTGTWTGTDQTITVPSDKPVGVSHADLRRQN